MEIAIVTGTSTGIGFATALRLAREGCRVYGTVRSEASGAALLEAAGDLPLSLLVLDVDDDASVANGIASVIAAEGQVDILVNNAGVSALTAVEGMAIDEFQSVMNTNAWGGLRGIKAVLPTMREQGRGNIVNVTSIAGRVAVPGQGAYAASKWAMEAISEVLALEAAPFGIRVAIVEPGVVLTPLVDKGVQAGLDMKSPYIESVLRTGRLLMAGVSDPASADDVAGVIWHAISTDAPKLRYQVGRDAVAIAAQRPALTDEEWIAGFTMVEDDTWREHMKAWSDTEVPGLG